MGDGVTMCDRCHGECKKVFVGTRGAKNNFYAHLCPRCKKTVDRERQRELDIKRRASRDSAKEPLKRLRKDMEDLGAL